MGKWDVPTLTDNSSTFSTPTGTKKQKKQKKKKNQSTVSGGLSPQDSIGLQNLTSLLAGNNVPESSIDTGGVDMSKWLLYGGVAVAVWYFFIKKK